MILISHRGNINGRIEKDENNPDYIDNAIKLGYEVEIDIWFKEIDKEPHLYLGHDKPQYLLDFDWLSQRIDNLWIHCKNIEAIEFFTKHERNYNFFWHENDTLTLTSKKVIWAYPGKQPIKNSIAVMPELFNDNLDFCKGICSDYIQNYKK
jgi:hypothetical protein